MLTLAVDVGGTHTDLYGWNPVSSEKYSAKVPTTPNDLTEGVLNAISTAGVALKDVDRFMHSSTTTTNAVIEGTFPRTPFITTEGFRDQIEIGRYHREELYDPYQQKPDPLASRRDRYTVPERLDAQGTVIEELDERAVRNIATTLEAQGVRNVAVGFINSYQNPVHERRVKEILLEELDDLYVALSAETTRKLGTIPRFNTAIMNAALQPIISDYLDSLHTDLRAEGFEGVFNVIRSDGGVGTLDAIKQHAEATILSGPAAGVKGCEAVGHAVDESNVIGMDMGGTSTDVSLIDAGEPLVTTEYEIKFDIPIARPMLDVTTIGSGGGSIAWIDDGGSLRVGPRSAGADPGPVCYDYGGTSPTVTDANLVLGRLDPAKFLGGTQELNVQAAEASIEELASELGLSPLQTAEGIIRIANENMAAAVRETTIGRGRDPRDYILVGFGGCGPMHASAVGDTLGIPTVVIPLESGVLSATGATIMKTKHSEDITVYEKTGAIDADSLTDQFESLEDSVLENFRSQGIPAKDVELNRISEMRYAGQTYEVDVPTPSRDLTQSDIEMLKEAFHERHETEYGVSTSDFEVSFVNLRVTGIEKRTADELPQVSHAEHQSSIHDTKDVYFQGAWRETDVYYREGLTSGTTITGPAMIEGNESTITLNPSMDGTLDEYGNLIIRTNPRTEDH